MESGLGRGSYLESCLVYSTGMVNDLCSARDEPSGRQQRQEAQRIHGGDSKGPAYSGVEMV